MRAHYWRMRTYAPYFDSRLSWSSKAWVYQSAYGILPGSSVDTQHPEWILRDAAGNKLYIPDGCSSGKCTQYAGDIGNPAYRQWWIDQSRAKLAMGYAGIYVDDVNLYRKVSNGLGQAVAPIDPRTGAVLTEPTWQRYLGDHMQGVRAAFPTAEIVHNAIWYAGDTHRRPAARPPRRQPDQPRARRQRRRRHGRDRQVELAVAAGLRRPSPGRGPRGRLRRRRRPRPPAASTGSPRTSWSRRAVTALGNNQGGTPTDWWTGYDVDLGTPLAGRYLWNGLIRRDFDARLRARQRARRGDAHGRTPGGRPRPHRHDTDEPDARRRHGGRLHHPVSARVDVEALMF